MEEDVEGVIPVKFRFNSTTIRMIIAQTTGELLTDFQIIEKYFNIDPIIIETESYLGKKQALELAIGLIALIHEHNKSKESKS